MGVICTSAFALSESFQKEINDSIKRIKGMLVKVPVLNHSLLTEKQ